MSENATRPVTEGGLLDGKIKYRQFASGHRSGFEPVLLAACVPAQVGERVLEGGCGAGAALLCLGHRVPGISGLGVEIEPDMAALADENFKFNGFRNISSLCSAVEALNIAAAFEHVMANPPWHLGTSTQSSDKLRALAHHARPSLLSEWIVKLVACLKPHGTLTLILPAIAMAEAEAVMRAQELGAITVFPLWPRAGRPAKLGIIAGALNMRGPDRVLPGLILHDENGITEAAQAVLRGGEAISLS